MQDFENIEDLADYLNDGLNDVDGILEIWVDDIQLGTGDVLCNNVSVEELFDQHLICIERILVRAKVANLRFKLPKCWFCQFEIDTLGMVAGFGCLKPDPKKHLRLRFGRAHPV